MRIGWHASHEQLAPSELLALVVEAEGRGFDCVLSSDHFHPWSDAQGQSGYAWSWLGAAMARTTLPFRVVTAPGQRQHPAIVAQAAATLAEMFEDRFWVCAGTGQLLNEHVVGGGWPSKAERAARLRECVDVMRRLWAGETVNHNGRVVVEDARLYTRPRTAPRLLAAALTPTSARWAGAWADGLITASGPLEATRAVVEAFREGGGAGKPMILKAQVAHGRSRDEARAAALEQWKTNLVPSVMTTDLRMPADFASAAECVDEARLEQYVRISPDPHVHAQWLEEDAALGFDEVILHNVTRDQRAFLAFFGDEVLPLARANASRRSTS